jgi:hypothetical protein
MSKRKTSFIPSYTYEETSDPNVRRFVDREGNWTHYFLVKQKKFVKAVNWILSLGYNKGPRFAMYLSRTTEDEQRATLIKAGDEGTRSHRAISSLIAGSRVTMTTKFPSDLVGGRQEPLNDAEWDNLQAFENWCNVYKPRLVAQDQTVHTNDYAGTFDALFVLTVPEKDKVFQKNVWGKEVLILIDWKTSSGIHEEYHAQLAAYWAGIRFVKKWEKYVEAYKGRCFTGIVRIGTRHAIGFEFKVWDLKQTLKKNLLEFMSAQVIANAYEPEFNPEIKEIKTDFFITVPKAKVEKPKKLKKNKKIKK